MVLGKSECIGNPVSNGQRRVGKTLKQVYSGGAEFCIINGNPEE